MGAIEPRVKLAICMRVLFGEPIKTLAQLFCVSVMSCSAAVDLYLDFICNCQMLAFGQVPSLADLQLRALEFSRRSTYPLIFQHCVEAIDGILVRPSDHQFYNFNAYLDQNTVPCEGIRSEKFLFRTQARLWIEFTGRVRLALQICECVSVLSWIGQWYHGIQCQLPTGTICAVPSSILRRWYKSIMSLQHKMWHRIHFRRQCVSGWRFFVDALISRFNGQVAWCLQLFFVTIAHNDWKKFRNLEHCVRHFAEAAEI